MYRNDREQYNKIVREEVERSKKDIPENVTIPKSSKNQIRSYIIIINLYKKQKGE